MEFLHKTFAIQFGPEVASTLVDTHRDSTLNQYESAWKRFQSWLPRGTVAIDNRLVLSYLNSLSSDLAPRTILVHRNALKLPLSAAFDVDLSQEVFSLLARAQFRLNPPARRVIPSWSLDSALEALQAKDSSSLSLEELLMKTLFLVAVASGNRASELAAIDRPKIVLRGNGVTLPVSEGFLFKNQSLSHSPSPISFPSLGRGNLALCPIASLKAYLARTSPSASLFCHPHTGAALNAGGVAFWLVKAINWLIPDACPRAHDVRKLSLSLAYARGLPIKEIVEAGSWQSPSTFVLRYLSKVPRGTVDCVTGRRALRSNRH